MKKFLIVTTVSDSMPFFNGQINVLKKTFDIELVSSAGIHLDEMCLKHAVVGHRVKMKREISIWSDIQSLGKLIKLFYRIRPAVVHANTPKASLLSLIASYIVRVPHRIYYIHGLRYSGENGVKRKFLMKLEAVSCYLATDLIAVSEGLSHTIKEDRITSKPIKLIGHGGINGVDVDYFNPSLISNSEIKKQYGILDTDFIYGFIGRLVGDKGINELIRAFSIISKENKNAKLLLVGQFENNLDPLDVATLEEIKSNSNILHVGFQKDVRPFLKTMNVFVFPSYREGLATVLMETGAMSVPAICSNISGCKEVVAHKENGFLINKKDEIALLETMRYCIENTEVLKNMAIKARSVVIEKFEQKQHWERSLKMYEEIVK